MWFFWRNIYTIWNERHSGWDSPSHLQRDSNLMLPLKPEEQGFPLLLPLLRIMQLVAGEVQHGKGGHSVQYWETSPCPLICPLLLSLSSLRRIAGIIAKTHLPMQWGWTWWALKVCSTPNYCIILLFSTQHSLHTYPTPLSHTHISIASLAFCLHFFFFSPYLPPVCTSEGCIHSVLYTHCLRGENNHHRLKQHINPQAFPSFLTLFFAKQQLNGGLKNRVRGLGTTQHGLCQWRALLILHRSNQGINHCIL